jgi:hypothetical protein
MSNVASAMNGGGYQNPGGTRTWFQGAPDTGSPPNIPVPANFNDTASNNSSAGRISDQANIALSVGIYNWLRQMGLRPNWSSVLAALKHDLRSLVPNGGGTTVTAWNTADPFIPPAYAATNGGTMPTTTVWTSVPQGMAADPRSMQNILQSGQPGDSTVQMANVFGYVPAGVPAPPTAAAVFIDSNGNPTSTTGKPLDEIVWVQDSITTTNAAGKIATTAGERVYNEMAAEEQRLTSEITALQADMSSKQAQQQQYRGQANALRSQAGGTPPPSNADSLRSQADSLDRQASALDGPIADDQSKINAKQNDLTNRVRPTKARGDRCNQRGAQAMDVTTKMLQNFQALTAIGCSGQVPQFSLGGSTFWAHNFVANQLAPKDPAQVTEAQISAMVAMIKDKNSQLDCKSAPGEVWDKTAALTIYQRTASASPPIPAIGYRFGMFSPAYARNASPMPPNSFVGFQQPNLNLMFLYSVRGDASKDRGQGQMYITALPTSPFIRQNTEAGQVFYSNIQALQTAGPTVAGRGPLTLTWAMFMRDNVANPHAPPTYLQGLRDIRNATDSNRNNLNWCQDGAKDLNGNSYNVNLPDAGDASFVCPTLDGEFVISCPMVSGCSEGMSINNKTGTAEVKPCPPPDPPMG